MKDLHVHTTYCDGKNTPEEMVLSAIEKGLDTLGFSVHSYMDFDLSYCIQKERIEDYKNEINALKEKYRDKIEILCGVELDYLSVMDVSGFDYKIGSVHYVKTCDGYEAVDLDENAFSTPHQLISISNYVMNVVYLLRYIFCKLLRLFLQIMDEFQNHSISYVQH